MRALSLSPRAKKFFAINARKKKEKIPSPFFFSLPAFTEKKNSQSSRGEEISVKITEGKSGDERSERFVVEEKAWSDGNRGGVWKIWGSAGWDTWQPPVAWWRFERRSNLAGYRLPGNAYYRISTGGSKVSACQPSRSSNGSWAWNRSANPLSCAQIIARKFPDNSIILLDVDDFRDLFLYSIHRSK